MPCDAWLGLDQYQDGQLVGKAAWLGQQLDTLVSANKCAIKSIQKTTLRNKLCVGGDELHIPIGNHVLLRVHPEGQNKFKDQYKSDIYVVVVDSHKEELMCIIFNLWIIHKRLNQRQLTNRNYSIWKDHHHGLSHKILKLWMIRSLNYHYYSEIIHLKVKQQLSHQ